MMIPESAMIKSKSGLTKFLYTRERYASLVIQASFNDTPSKTNKGTEDCKKKEIKSWDYRKKVAIEIKLFPEVTPHPTGNF